MLIKNGIAISMDGKGAWRDNVFVERLWRSVKYEEVYLRAYDGVSARPALRSAAISTSIMAADRTRALTAHTRSSLLHPAALPHGSLTPAEAPLIDAENLFRQPGPPHRPTSATRTSSTRSGTPNLRRIGSRSSGADLPRQDPTAVHCRFGPALAGSMVGRHRDLEIVGACQVLGDACFCALQVGVGMPTQQPIR